MELQDLQQRNQELSTLNSIAQDLNKEVELENALNATLRQAVHLLNLRTGWIWLLNEETGSAYLAAGYNLPSVFQNKPELLTGWCHCIDKYLSDNVDDASNISEITCTRLKDLEEGTEGLRFHASVPLVGSNGKVGILNAVSQNSRQLSDSQLQLLYTIGDMLSIAIERARLFENSKQLGIVEERNRLAREIHDTLAQGLSAISLRLESIQVLFEKNKLENVPQLVQETLDLTKSNIEAARRSVLDLRATPLAEDNLVEALEKLARRVNQDNTLACSLKASGSYRRSSMRVEFGLFRIAQEAILNVIKHAQATELGVHIAYSQNAIRLTVTDNGQGFDAEMEVSGFGLIGISERVKLLAGSLEIESKKGEGTMIQCTIPTGDE